jgi:hypothetical protein
MPTPPKDRFETLDKVSDQKSRSLPAEMIGLLRSNRKWWLVPILILILLLALLLVLGGTGAAPFIYSIF